MAIIILLSIIMYVAAGVIVYNNIHSFTKQEKIKFMLIGTIVILILTIIICSITSSQIKIENQKIINITKITAILIFSPINSIIILQLIGSTLNKYKNKAISEEKFKKRFIIIIIVIIILAIIEFGYVKNFQLGLLKSVIK